MRIPSVQSLADEMLSLLQAKQSAGWRTVDSIDLEWLIDLISERAALIAKRDALRAEVEALRQDAKRYRWMRSRMVGANFNWDDEGMVVLAFEVPGDLNVTSDCDANIDVAMNRGCSDG